MLQERSETPQGICLPVIHVHMERIGLSRLVVDPDLQAIALDVELGDEPAGGDAADPHRIYMGVRGVESKVR